jgi:ABC-type nitrate/sulfonate/bicarbonate transport system permease component
MIAGAPVGAAAASGRLSQATFLAGVLAIWYVVGEAGLVSRILLPPLPEVLAALPKVFAGGEFRADLVLTLCEVFAAFAIAASLGVAVGYFVGRSHAMTREFEPLIAAGYAVPLVLFFPVFVLFFGLGPSSKIAMAAAIAFFPIALSTIAGFSSVNPSLVSAARLMGASNLQMTWTVLIPAALPVIATGLRMGLVVSMLAVVGTETIVSTGGLGHRMVALSEMMETPSMYAYILVIIVVASLLTALSGRAERSLRVRMGAEP